MGAMTINKEEINRAIYLDFESEGEKRNGTQPPPVLGGVMVETIYTPTLLHPDLAHAAEAKEWAHTTLADYLKSIHDQANAESRRIVFFSSAESTIFADHGIDISQHGFDLRDAAKRSGLYQTVWDTFKDNVRRFRDPDTAQTTRNEIRTKSFGLLTLVAADLGMQRPDSYGAGKTGARIRYALKQAGKKSDYASWSSGGKTKLTQVVDHNKHDCKATRCVLEHLAANS
ncbi:MAG: hypothetical protein P8J45_00790 [Phycisphaerales bacterium]|jgi:hypothetical protein|nr:hypothetical protein [Phycisphaerales bacterium]